VNDLLYSIGQDTQSINKLQEQISTGSVVNSPSDDPTLNQRLMLLQDQMDQNNTYIQNADYAGNFLTQQSSALGSAVSLMTNVKSMLLSAANDSNPQDLQDYGTQLDQDISQLLDLANTQFGGKYIFGGSQTTTQPFFLNASHTAVTANPNGVDGTLQLDISSQMSLQYNVTGAQAFNNGQMFNDLISIKNELDSGTVPTQADITTVDSYLNSLINTNAQSGAMMDRFQLVQNQLTSQNQSLTSTMSNLGDTDVAAATIKLQQQQTTLSAALQTGASVIQLSLANFL